jgi:hypothetical protein
VTRPRLALRAAQTPRAATPASALAGERQALRGERQLQAGEQRDGELPSGLPPARRRGWIDLAAAAAYLAAALVLTSPLWPLDRALRHNRDDPIFFQWMLQHAVRIFTHGENPLFAAHLNAPYGLNLMANTSSLGLTIPMVPITVMFGARVSLLVLLAGGLAATAFTWYFVLSRHIVRSPLAAFLAGAFCGFAPGMLAQANGHPNIVNQFLVPLLVLAVLRLRAPQRWLRNGLVLAGLVVYQAFINPEILFLAALTLGLFVLVYGILRSDAVRPLLRSAVKAFGVTILVAGVALAYPMYWQFFGPSAYHGLPVGVQEFGTDLAALPAFSSGTLAGLVEPSHGLASSAAEENTFFGWPLLLVLAVAVVLLWRLVAVRVLALTAIVFGLLSLGPHIRIRGDLTAVPGPWSVLGRLPLFDSVVPTRLGLVLIPLTGILIGLSVDRIASQVDSSGLVRTPARLRPLWIVAVLLAMVPITPTPLAASPPHVPPTPTFFTSGTWRSHVPADGVVLALPPRWGTYLTAMQWQLDTGLDFAIVGGYYLAPVPDAPDRRAIFGPTYPPTARLLSFVRHTGVALPVSGDLRRQARDDLRAWRVTTLVLVDSTVDDPVRAVVDELVGRGRRVDDVWVWDVRSFVAG